MFKSGNGGHVCRDAFAFYRRTLRRLYVSSLSRFAERLPTLSKTPIMDKFDEATQVRSMDLLAGFSALTHL